MLHPLQIYIEGAINPHIEVAQNSKWHLQEYTHAQCTKDLPLTVMKFLGGMVYRHSFWAQDSIENALLDLYMESD